MKVLQYVFPSFRMVTPVSLGAFAIATLTCCYMYLKSTPTDVRLRPVATIDPVSDLSLGIISELEGKRGKAYPRAWRDSVWWSSEFPMRMRHALQLYCLDGKNLTIALVGGSSSAPQQSWLYHLGWKLQMSLETVCAEQGSKITGHLLLLNPSQGDTTSVWGALYLDTLIPESTDIILWEYTINDSIMSSLAEVSPSDLRRRVFEVFLRRAVSRNPHLMLGMISTWPKNASACWPCASASESYQDLLWVARGYLGLGAFALNVASMLHRMMLAPRQIFKDHHHPADSIYEVVGDALLQLILAQLMSASSAATHGLVSASAGGPLPEALSIDKKEQRTLMFSGLFGFHPLLLCILNRSRPLASFSLFQPAFGRSVKPQSMMSATPVGKALAHRTDRKYMGQIPLCNETSQLAFPLLANDSSLEFVGLSLFPNVYEDWFSNAWQEVIQVSADGQPMRCINTDELKGHGAGFLSQGSFHDPQGWFALPQGTRLHRVVSLSICQKLLQFRLTGVVFV